MSQLADAIAKYNKSLETGPFRDEPKPEHAWVEQLLDRYILPQDLRGDGTHV